MAVRRPRNGYSRLLKHGLPCALAFFVASGLVFAGSPRIAFDLPPTVACRDATPADWAAEYPEQRIIEATFLVSVRVRSGDASAIEEVAIEVTQNAVWRSSRTRSLAHRRLALMQVVGFSPHTELATDVAGEIETTSTTERSESLSASLGGAVPVPYGEVVAQIAPSVKASSAEQSVTTEISRRLPPLETVVVSGTTDRGRGVFFQLRRSSQGTLEGVHELSVRFAVPTNWRLGHAHVACRATGHEHLLWMKQERTWARTELPVVLFEESDGKARAAANRAADEQRADCGCRDECLVKAQFSG